MTTFLDTSISDEEAALFFCRLKKDLNCRSTRRVVSLVRVILSKIRTSYNMQQLSTIITKTPSWFHLLLIGSWKISEGREIHHIDELVEDIINEEHLKDSGFFKSEIDGLNSVVTVLGRVHQLFKTIGVNAFNYTLSRELNYALAEDVN